MMTALLLVKPSKRHILLLMLALVKTSMDHQTKLSAPSNIAPFAEQAVHIIKYSLEEKKKKEKKNVFLYYSQICISIQEDSVDDLSLQIFVKISVLL